MASNPRAGGRPTASPPPMTYAEWKAAGYPQLLLSVAHVAAWCNLSVMRVNTYCKRGALIRVNTKIDTADPTNREWLLNREGYEKNELFQNGGRPAGTPGVKKPPSVYVEDPNGPFGMRKVDPPPPPSENNDPLDLDAILEAIAKMDLTKISSAAVQKVQRLEAALKTRVEREAKRNQLIERSLVAVVFARLYQIDSNELRTIGAKVAPTVAGELGVENPEAQLRIEKLIDDEVLKVLAHIKRLMDDFLQGVGAEAVPDE